MRRMRPFFGKVWSWKDDIFAVVYGSILIGSILFFLYHMAKRLYRYVAG